jgi:ribosomal protein S6--L-glutamate ligase
MHTAVLGNAGSWYVTDLQRAASARGDRCTRIDYRAVVASVTGTSVGVQSGELTLAECDAVLVRTMPPGSLEQVVFRMDCLLMLAARGVTVLNSPRAVECAVDKYLCTAKLSAAGLPVPDTAACERSDEALAAFERLGGDVVVKPIFGSEGRGIVRVSDPDLALRTFRTLERLQAVLYLQKFVPHEGFDVRVLVLDGQVVGGMKRANPHDFRTNVSRKAHAAAHEVTEAEAELALRAAAAVGARFAGIDLLYHRGGGCYVIEVNAVPGWRAFQRVTEIDVAARLLDSLHVR